MEVGEAIQVRTRVHTLASTTMSDHCIPPEIWDHIVDFLHDHPETLMQCCLVSRSWVSRTRKHLFAIVKFSSRADFEEWKKTFPDPSNSPAHYTHALSIGLGAVTAADAAEGDCLPTFSRIVSLEVFAEDENNLEKYLAPFHNTLKSLGLMLSSFGHSQVIHLICRLPLLEDLTLIGRDRENDGPPRAASPSLTPPPLTGTLLIHPGMTRKIAGIVHQFLRLPNGLHFRSLKLFSWTVEDFLSVGRLVEACSDSLQYLDVLYGSLGAISSIHSAWGG